MKGIAALALLAAACASEPAAAPTRPPAPWVAKPTLDRRSPPPTAEQSALDEIDRALKYMAEVRELPVKDHVAGTVIAREALLSRLRSEVEDDLDPALVADGAESLAEDDMNEDGQLSEIEHLQACDLAVSISRAIRNAPFDEFTRLIALYGSTQPDP